MNIAQTNNDKKHRQGFKRTVEPLNISNRLLNNFHDAKISGHAVHELLQEVSKNFSTTMGSGKNQKQQIN